jgi:hypothetical protein
MKSYHSVPYEMCTFSGIIFVLKTAKVSPDVFSIMHSHIYYSVNINVHVLHPCMKINFLFISQCSISILVCSM